MKRGADKQFEGRSSLFLLTSKENFEFLEISAKTIDESEAVPKKENPTKYDLRKPITMQKFTDILSSVGQRVKHIRILYGNPLILPKIRKHCKNLRRIELLDGEGSLPLQDYRNLIEMKLPNVRMATHAFRKCLLNNSGLESLEFDYFWYSQEINDLLELLPNLQRLRLCNVRPSYDKLVSKNILSSEMLTVFSFVSEQNCNDLLTELSKKFNLEELDVTMLVNPKAFEIIGKMQNLELLSIASVGRTKPKLPEGASLPPKLKRLHLNGMNVTDKAFLSTVNKLQFLEEFHIGSTTAKNHPWLYNDEAISEIADKIKATLGRVLKTFVSGENKADGNFNTQHYYKSKTGHLEIIYGCAANTKTKPLRISIECESAECQTIVSG